MHSTTCCGAVVRGVGGNHPATRPPSTVSCGPRRGKQRKAGVKSDTGEKRAGGGGGGGLGFGLQGKLRGSGEAAAPSPTTWRCARGCGACCKLDKGPAFPTPWEIFTDDPSHAQLYESMIGPDGWCVHYEHTTRTCSIYSERPFFCRVEPGVFRTLFGVEEKRFDSEACRSCRDTIKAVYGSQSQELKNFNHNIGSSNVG